MRSKRGYPEKFSSKKLAPNLYSKMCYVTHLRSLKFALKQGVKIIRIIRAISFNQSAWIRDYVMVNTLRRRAAVDDYERSFFKYVVG